MNVTEQIKKCKAEIADLEFKLAVEKAVFARFSAIVNSGQIATQDESRPIIPNSIVPHIRSILLAKGKPMKVAQLYKAIQKQGIPIKGKTEPKRLISSALTRRNDLFQRVGRGLYKLKIDKEVTREVAQE